jgi:hypothetical protein
LWIGSDILKGEVEKIMEVIVLDFKLEEQKTEPLLTLMNTFKDPLSGEVSKHSKDQQLLQEILRSCCFGSYI